MPHQTVGSMILDRIQESPARPALRYKSDGDWKSVTWKELGGRMERIASGLLTALDEELADDAHVAIIGNTSVDWIACDFAAISVGLRTVPVYATLLEDECGYLLQDTGSVICIVENAEQYRKAKAVENGFTFFDVDYDADAIKVRHYVVFDTTGMPEGDDWESLADLEARGAEKLEETAAERKRRLDGQKRSDTVTYTYTSGTTGPPKGVIQTNDNVLAMLEAVEKTPLFGRNALDGGFFLFLPLAHSFGRLIEFGGPFADSEMIISSVPTLLDDLTTTRPGFIPSAPRVFEKIKSKIETTVASAPPIRQKLFGWAIDAGKATIPYRSKGQPIPFGVALKYRVADKLVLSKLRAKLGFDKAGILLSGSAPLDPEVHRFFLAWGLEVMEAYGLTETCPGLTSNLPGNFRIGTVGLPFPGIDIKIAADGEILAKGANITQGYLHRPEATAEAFDEEGWFHTGDLGAMDDEGFVKITGRKKELMKTSGGKYIAPAKIEGRLKLLPIVQEAVVVADYRNFATALIAVDPEELKAWSEQTGNGDDLESEAVAQAIQAHVDEVNGGLAQYESIKYFRVIPALTVEEGFLTASLKVKRSVVYERYEALIEDMYQAREKAAS